MGFYPTNTRVMTDPVKEIPVNKERENRQRMSQLQPIDRLDAEIMTLLTRARARNTRRKDWPKERARILGVFDLVEVTKADGNKLRWAK